MAIQVKRKELNFWERLYLPEIARGMSLTFKHLFGKKVTLQYPEERPVLAPNYRGMPVLVKDQHDRIKCVACQLCQFVCPPEAITITPRELDGSNVEKGPERFDLNGLRCIFCGYCEEVCPEEAIFLSKNFEFAPTSRAEMILPMEKLLEMGGERHDEIEKWSHK
jgi:NADH-quinone oxidoreductase subunit I